MISARTFVPAALAALLTIGSALLQADTAAAYSKTITAKCSGDYKRLCPSYKTESDGLRACMRANYRAISTRCMDALIAAGEAPPSARTR